MFVGIRERSTVTHFKSDIVFSRNSQSAQSNSPRTRDTCWGSLAEPTAVGVSIGLGALTGVRVAAANGGGIGALKLAGGSIEGGRAFSKPGSSVSMIRGSLVMVSLSTIWH